MYNTVRDHAVRGVQHLLLANRPDHVRLRENKGQSRSHRPADMPVSDARMELVDNAFRNILRRGDDPTTQALVAYAAANLRRTSLWPRILRLAEKSKDVFPRLAAYHALLDMPDMDQIDRLMVAFGNEEVRARLADKASSGLGAKVQVITDRGALLDARSGPMSVKAWYCSPPDIQPRTRFLKKQ